MIVDVPINWATKANWYTKLLDTWKVTRLNLLNQESVKLAGSKECDDHG